MAGLIERISPDAASTMSACRLPPASTRPRFKRGAANPTRASYCGRCGVSIDEIPLFCIALETRSRTRFGERLLGDKETGLQLAA